MSEQHTLAAATAARQARSEARPDMSALSIGAAVRKGIVTAAHENGTFSVVLVGASGAPMQELPNLSARGAILEVGAAVAVVFEPGQPLPWILAGASGSGGSAGTLVTGYIRFFAG